MPGRRYPTGTGRQRPVIGVSTCALSPCQPRPPHRVSWSSKIFSWVLLGGRQGEPKHGASRLISVYPQPTAMRVDDGPADRQPHPKSAGLCRVEGIENPLEMLNAGP